MSVSRVFCLPPVPPEVPEDLLSVGVDQVGPGLPQWVADVVDEANLVGSEGEWNVFVKELSFYVIILLFFLA